MCLCEFVRRFHKFLCLCARCLCCNAGMPRARVCGCGWVSVLVCMCELVSRVVVFHLIVRLSGSCLWVRFYRVTEWVCEHETERLSVFLTILICDFFSHRFDSERGLLQPNLYWCAARGPKNIEFQRWWLSDLTFKRDLPRNINSSHSQSVGHKYIRAEI